MATHKKNNRTCIFILLGTTVILVVTICGYLLYQGQSLVIPPDPQRIAYERLVDASAKIPELYFQNGFPRGVLVNVKVEGTNAIERAANFLETYRDLYLQSDPALDLKVKRVHESGEHVTFYQTYQGLPVYTAEIVVSVDEDIVYATVGGLLTEGVELDTTPAIADQDAEEIARVHLQMPEAPIIGHTTLLVFDQSIFDDVSPEPHLAWRVSIGGKTSWIVFIDAHAGDVIFAYALEFTGSGLEDYDFEEFDADGYNASLSNCYWTIDGPFHIGSEGGLEKSYHNDVDAVNAWWSVQDAYLFYHENFGLHSYDNDNTQIEAGVHAVFAKGPNAQWWPGCEIMEFSSGWVAYDVVVHELTHGVIQFTSNLNYYYEPGALNESYADVMASFADGNWTVGEARPAGGAFRSLSDPPLFGHPDHMSECKPIVIDIDFGGVHTNSGIPNKAAYLIAHGDTHPQTGVKIDGVGNGMAMDLYYSVMTSLPANALFIDARNKTVAIADQQYGTDVACQVRNAFFAVGLGKPDIDCDGKDDNPDKDGDGVPFGLDNCPTDFNPKQDDLDGDGNGLACDLDDQVKYIWESFPSPTPNIYFVCPTPGVPCDLNNYDGDKWTNDKDNCPWDVNDDQKDTDGDGEGDACDPDEDGDGWSNDADNCPFTPNPDQANADGDGAGDACDLTPDCNDVKAWSTGTNIIGPDGEDISIPPKPVQDPMLCNPDFVIAGQPWGHVSELLKPDGARQSVVITRGENPYVILPLPLCPTEDADMFHPEYRGQVNLYNLPPQIRAWIADDEGQSLAKRGRNTDTASLLYQPWGGRNAYLVLALLDISPGEQTGFDIFFQCGLKDTFIITPAPTETSTPTPTETSTPTPTETSTPTPTSTLEGPCTLTALVNLFCRAGPGRGFEDLDSFLPGQTALVIGQSLDGNYWYVAGPNFGRTCTVPNDPQLVTLAGSCEERPRFTPVPTYTPTPTATSTPAPQCSDGIDNDGDGQTDLADRECRNANDNSEAVP